MIEYRVYITRSMLQSEPKKLFVFGDNLKRKGYGGQAKEMRGEYNAVGIPTKHRPSMEEDAFFSDDDFSEFFKSFNDDLIRLVTHKGIIVWPKAGIGTGRAQLEERAPNIHKFIEIIREYLEI